jgi:hypothetical protein
MSFIVSVGLSELVCVLATAVLGVAGSSHLISPKIENPEYYMHRYACEGVHHIAQHCS